MKSAVFRADGSSHLGMGHIMRCVAFASSLADMGVSPLFVTKAFDPCVANVIRANGFDVTEIAPGATPQEDAEQTRVSAASIGGMLIVTDLCHREMRVDPRALDDYQRSLADGYFTLTITGDLEMDVPADVVVSPYVTSPLIRGGKVHLSGPSYFIFRPEFISAACMSRTVNDEAQRVLVTVGGSDEPHLTAKIVRALCALSDPGLSLRVVLGAGYSDQLRGEVKTILKRFDGEYELLDHAANLAEAMLWADLAITGDGLTKYETAVTGTPSIVLSHPASEKSMNHEFEMTGTAVHLGDGILIAVDVLAEEIRQVLGNAPLRRSMSQRGKGLVDGKGLERIISHIPEGVFR